MKRFFIIFIIIVFTNVSPTAYAVSLTPNPSPTVSSAQKNEELNEQINDLKEKIASKVAELNLVEKRGIIGKVTDASNAVLTLEDLNKNLRIVDVDEITKFSSIDEKESIGITDIKSGQFISVLGTYNKNTKRILARFITVQNVLESLTGFVTNIDKQNFTITVVGDDKTPKIIDIETTTAIYTFGGDEVVRKTGFSKVTTNDKAVILGTPHKSEKNRFLGDKIILLPTLPKNPKSM